MIYTILDFVFVPCIREKILNESEEVHGGNTFRPYGEGFLVLPALLNFPSSQLLSFTSSFNTRHRKHVAFGWFIIFLSDTPFPALSASFDTCFFLAIRQRALKVVLGVSKRGELLITIDSQGIRQKNDLSDRRLPGR